MCIRDRGYVAWGGCGFMGPTPGKIKDVLPNLGLGLRIEVQPHMNVRLDFPRILGNLFLSKCALR